MSCILKNVRKECWKSVTYGHYRGFCRLQIFSDFIRPLLTGTSRETTFIELSGIQITWGYVMVIRWIVLDKLKYQLVPEKLISTLQQPDDGFKFLPCIHTIWWF